MLVPAERGWTLGPGHRSTMHGGVEANAQHTRTSVTMLGGDRALTCAGKQAHPHRTHPLAWRLGARRCCPAAWPPCGWWCGPRQGPRRRSARKAGTRPGQVEAMQREWHPGGVLAARREAAGRPVQRWAPHSPQPQLQGRLAPRVRPHRSRRRQRQQQRRQRRQQRPGVRGCCGGVRRGASWRCFAVGDPPLPASSSPGRLLQRRRATCRR